MSQSATKTKGTRYVVAVSGDETSPATLHWVAMHAPADAEVLVVHATNVAVRVLDGPSRAMAAHMDGSPWTTVWSSADDALVGHEHHSIVDHGDVVEVVARHAGPGDVLLIGHVPGRRRRRRLSAALHERVGAPVLAIDRKGAAELLAGINAPAIESLTATDTRAGEAIVADLASSPSG